MHQWMTADQCQDRFRGRSGQGELCEVFDEEPGMEEKENKGQGTKQIDLKYNKKQYRLSAYLCF